MAVRKIRSCVYTVVGRGHFPDDMLRYDCAWPLEGEIFICHNCERERYNEIRRVKLASGREPTKERWASFGWTVERVEVIR